MRVVFRSFFIVVLLGFFAAASAQLPLKIMADKHLIHAEQLYAAKDYTGAFNVMEQIIALQKEHNLTLSDDFHFKYAQVALSVDSTRIALESVNKYLSATGKEGQFYKEALALLLKAEGHEVLSEEDFYNEVIKTEGTCEGLPVGSSCWMELTNHPECYFWNDDLKEDETAIWAGKCSGHLPDGKGTLTQDYIWRWAGAPDEPIKNSVKNTGSFQKGKKHGQWVASYSDGSEEGSYVKGKKHGQWVTFERSDGDEYFSRISYVNGKRHGYWVRSHGYVKSDDLSVVEGLDLDGEELDAWGGYMRPDWSVEVESPDENGNGHLIYRNSDGAVWGGAYVNGKRHGQWIERTVWHLDQDKDTVGEGSYVNGKAHGHWVYRYPDGVVSEVPCVNGKWHGHWVGRDSSGTVVSKGSYVDGQRHGHWVARITDNIDKRFDDIEKRFLGEGSYVERFVGEGSYVESLWPEKHGQWVYRHPNGDILKVEYKYGYRRSPFLWYDYDEEKCWSFYWSDDVQEIKKKKVNKKRCLE